jgi:hypothetical protein
MDRMSTAIRELEMTVGAGLREHDAIEPSMIHEACDLPEAETMHIHLNGPAEVLNRSSNTHVATHCLNIGLRSGWYGRLWAALSAGASVGSWPGENMRSSRCKHV